MTLGIITAIFLVLASGKFITKRLPWKSIDRAFRKIHAPAGYVVCVIAVIHFIMSLKLIRQRPIEMYIVGIVMLLCAIIALFTYLCRHRNRQWLKIHKAVALLMIIGLCIHIFYGFSSLSDYQNTVKNISVSDVDVTKVADGDYIGECNVQYIYAKVRVVIENGVITKIELLEHRNERGGAASQITDKVVTEQKVNVDAISGATNSSKVIKKAIENAIQNGKKEAIQ